MLNVTATVVGEVAAESWKQVLKGLWTSTLRLEELMHVSWDKPGSIRPVWKKGLKWTPFLDHGDRWKVWLELGTVSGVVDGSLKVE